MCDFYCPVTKWADSEYTMSVKIWLGCWFSTYDSPHCSEISCFLNSFSHALEPWHTIGRLWAMCGRLVFAVWSVCLALVSPHQRPFGRLSILNWSWRQHLEKFLHITPPFTFTFSTSEKPSPNTAIAEPDASFYQMESQFVFWLHDETV